MKKQLVTPNSELGRRLGVVMTARDISARRWSIKAGLDKDFVSQVRRGRSESPSAENLKKLAREAEINLDYLLLRSDDMDLPDREIEGEPVQHGLVRMAGYIGAGARVIPFGIGEDIDRIAAPPDMTSGIAAVVRGISMIPVYRPGDIVIAAPWEGNIDGLLGEDCFVQVRDDLLFLKRLKKGRGRRYTLESYNEADTPPMVDQSVEWAAPVRWVKRK